MDRPQRTIADILAEGTAPPPKQERVLGEVLRELGIEIRLMRDPMEGSAAGKPHERRAEG